MESIWRKDLNMRGFPQLKGKHKTDVLIIGGGIAGILTAYMLKKNGVECMLLEKDRLCGGTTEGTTAKITFQHGLIYSKLLKNEGFDKAKSYLEANRFALKKYEEICKNIECDFEYKDSYIYSLNSRKKLEEELFALSIAGCTAEYCDTLKIPLKTVGAVKIPDQAQLHPLKFLNAVCENLDIYENSFVRELKGNTAVTAKGLVSADYIIVTTHFPFINKHGSYFLKLYQDRSYMLALENAQDVDGMYMDENGKGITFRNYKNYLLMGGAARRTGKQTGGWDELKSLARHCYPESKVYCQWAAQDCMSLDGMPYIGRYSKNTPRLLTASGFNKWGLTGSMLSAVMLSDTVMGRKNEFSETFSPSRSIMKKQLLVNGIEATANLLTVSKKRCPHLGCALKWNSAEHSWDCPCHGSRFDENGTVLDNPANGDLKL